MSKPNQPPLIIETEADAKAAQDYATALAEYRAVQAEAQRQADIAATIEANDRAMMEAHLAREEEMVRQRQERLDAANAATSATPGKNRRPRRGPNKVQLASAHRAGSVAAYNAARGEPGDLARKVDSRRKKGQKGPKGSQLLREAVSPHCKRYVANLVDPFDKPNFGLCRFPCTASVKQTSRAEGSFETQTGVTGQNFGCILMNPWNGMSNDETFAWKTKATSTAIDLRVGTAEGQVIIQSNSPFVGSDFDAGKFNQRRIVSAGLRIKYVGKRLDEGGVVIGVVLPSHQTINQENVDTLATKYPHAHVDTNKLGDGWYEVLWTPVYESEFAYYDNGTVATHSPSLDTACMGVAVQSSGFSSGVAVSAVFRYELVVNWEFTGPLAAGRNATPNCDDSVGVSAVLTMDQRVGGRYMRNPDKEVQDIEERVGYSLLESASGVGRLIAKYGTQAASAIGGMLSDIDWSHVAASGVAAAANAAFPRDPLIAGFDDPWTIEHGDDSELD